MIKSMLTLVAITAACGMMACAPARSQPETMPDIVLLQSRLAASEEKVDQLSQQVALLQAMVDSHRQTLQNLEQGLEDAGDGQIDAQPLPAASETPAASIAPQAESAPPLAVEQAPPAEDTSPATQSPPPEASRSLQQKAATQAPAADATPVIETTNPQYQQAMEILKSGDYETAAPLFEAFADEFPEDDLADNALYWAGECKYTQKKFTEAIERFKQVVEEYPNGSKVPDALLKIGFAYISLGDSESAEVYLKQVVAQYPFSSAGAKAEERLKALRQ